jgi:Hemerythrin HHE cation binding domain
MADNLAIVNRAIEEHHTIRGHMKLVGDSISDLEALFSLQKARPDWILSSPEALSEKQVKLRQTMSSLDEGLKNHFSFEERLFPPLFGELLMQALILEHKGMKKQLDEAESLVANTKLEGLSQKELLSKKAQIQQKIEGILQLVEEHAVREETILKMLKKALEAKR